MGRHQHFSPEFAADLSVAAEYYYSISHVTGAKFRERLNERLDLILSEPEGFAEIYDTVRAVRVRSYPYVILYETQQGHVTFLGLVHGAGKRENWFERFNKPR